MISESFSNVMDVELVDPCGHYIQALRHIINHQEEAAGMALNKCRQSILNGRHWIDLTDADVRKLIPDPDFTVDRFYALYGDYGSANKSPWVRDPEILAMIGFHIGLLGNKTDQARYAQMICRHMKDYGMIPVAAEAGQRQLAYH